MSAFFVYVLFVFTLMFLALLILVIIGNLSLKPQNGPKNRYFWVFLGTLRYFQENT